MLFSLMNPWIFFGLASLFSASACTQKNDASRDLKDAKWDKRVLVIHDPNSDPDLRQKLQQQESQMKDRDLIVIPADDILRQKFAITSEDLTVVLIGKDGGEKLRQTDEIDFTEIHSLIDRMPMRRQEIKEKRNSP